MKITREDLQNTYSSKTDQELALIDESQLTDLAREVLQGIKRERNISQELIIDTVTSNLNTKKAIKKMQKEKNIHNIKKFLFYIYVVILLSATGSAVKHFEDGMFIVPIILFCLPFLAYLFIHKSKK